ncbi:MAG: tetrahydromethanopterin S-methyltransferase subunit A [Methanocellales archaeon]|nr:tetrahydromethanopterin S-methyltransferase subunit A [Methanocellales archaeon]MDD3292088.1 tetrahydromethanopterin S-methyltransferase subunit A [Methanocellales archaeon]MDD5235325.1 tetrahydromethanopterin S-methyltransferase subunit A [Methanocellales archaeon]MDD5485727.1 tetrahydromethanopterin S-methyltransferase subunit A [Methanocellales archaeon]
MDEWPVIRGDYQIGDKESRVGIVTLASHFDLKPGELRKVAIMGSCKTENLGIEKAITNTISNPNIRFILLCGNESRGHLSGHTLKAIHANGIDDNGKIIGSEGAIPFIENISADAIERFQKQVQIIDLIGETNLEIILQVAEKYGDMGEIYPEPPFLIQAVKSKRQRRTIPISMSRDIMISENVFLDSSSGVIEICSGSDKSKK